MQNCHDRAHASQRIRRLLDEIGYLRDDAFVTVGFIGFVHGS